MSKKPTLKLVTGSAGLQPCRSASEANTPKGPPKITEHGQRLLDRMLDEGVIEGDSLSVLPALPRESVDLFFTSPPYADARAYSRIHPDRYVEWFLPFARAMFDAAKPSGSLIMSGLPHAAGSDKRRVSWHFLAPCLVEVIDRKDRRITKSRHAIHDVLAVKHAPLVAVQKDSRAQQRNQVHFFGFNRGVVLALIG
jgi:hypothetical protein